MINENLIKPVGRYVLMQWFRSLLSLNVQEIYHKRLINLEPKIRERSFPHIKGKSFPVTSYSFEWGGFYNMLDYEGFSKHATMLSLFVSQIADYSEFMGLNE